MPKPRPNRKPENANDSRATKVDIKKKQIIEAMKATLGNVTAACQKVGISRDTYYDYYNRDENFRNEINNISEMLVDFYEGKLHELVDALNPTAVIFALKCKGKKRGWIEKQEIVQTQQVVADDLDLSKLTDDELQSFLDIVKKCQKKSNE